MHAVAEWDPDGAGPATPLVVVGGSYAIAGTVQAIRIAAYDPGSGTWSPLGSGVNGTVSCLATLANGDLVAGGRFTVAGGVTVNGIARWDGSSWSAFGSGVAAQFPPPYPLPNVAEILVMPNGDLIAGGDFTSAGGVVVHNLARWDGASWSGVGGGLSGAVSALVTLPNGDLVAGGEFLTTTTGTVVYFLARWDGGTWSPFGGGMNFYVADLMSLPNGEVLAAGSFAQAGTLIGGISARHVARWDGSAWHAYGQGLNDDVFAIAMLPNGDLIAGGHFNASAGTATRSIARWNGSSWMSIGDLSPEVRAVTTLANGRLVAGGSFPAAGGVDATYVAQWDGSEWQSLGQGMSGGIWDLLELPNRDIVAVGDFRAIGAIEANRAARWDGNSWTAIGTGFDGVVFDALSLQNGDLIAAGAFTTADGAACRGVSRWDGNSWTTIGGGVFSGAGHAVTELPNGDLILGGFFGAVGGVPASGIARWNGSAWSALGAGVSGTVRALAHLPNGDVIAGGNFQNAGGVLVSHIARWDGASWWPLGAGVAGPNPMVTMVELMPNGDILAGGRFFIPGVPGARNIARFDGVTWSAIGNGLPDGVGTYSTDVLQTLPNGDLVVGGSFATRLARWDGVSWTPLGFGNAGQVHGLAMDSNGDLLVGGLYNFAGGVVSPHFSRLRATCPADAVPLGAGCTGSGGSNVLAAKTLPWLGSTFRARATGLATQTLAVGVFAPQQVSLAMPSVHPQGQPGCTLLVDDAILIEFARVNGSVDTEIAIPDAMALVGAVFYHQVVPIELNAAADITALTSTNALTLTVGVF